MAIEPSLSPTQAFLTAGILAFSYVAILYILPSARSRPWQKDPLTGQPRDRQHPDVIRARVFATILVTLLCLISIGCLVTVYGGTTYSADPIRATIHLTGFLPNYKPTSHLRLLFQPLLLTLTLFLGPIYVLILPPINQQSSSTSISDWFNLQVLRNLIVGPITEEIVFRGCIIATYLLIHPIQRPSATHIIFVSPLWFGAAHVHSIREMYLSNGQTKKALINSCLIAAFQFTYTTIFGWYASFIYLRTGSVVAASICHSFCNLMGIPPIIESFQEYPNRRLSISFSYILGVILFSAGVHSWATNQSLFPSNNQLWWDLK